MAVIIDGKTVRNLQEQVLKNANDIQDILSAERILADFGIKVLGNFPSVEALYEAYPPATYQGDYGDAYTIGTQAPFNFYVFTRTEEEGANGIWFNLGEFPQPGPQGEKGDTGEQGPKGDTGNAMLSGIGTPSGTADEGQLYLNTSTGTVYKYVQGGWNPVLNIKGTAGPQGPKGNDGSTGPQGPQGPQGEKGDVGGFINIRGIVETEDQLPSPSSLGNLTYAWLVGTQAPYTLYIQVGESSATAQWVNQGQLNLGTYVTVGGEFQNVWDADTKLDKKNNLSTVYGIDNDGNEKMYEVKSPSGNVGVLYTNAIPLYVNGRIGTNDPLNPYHCATKKYVDDNLPKIVRLG